MKIKLNRDKLYILAKILLIYDRYACLKRSLLYAVIISEAQLNDI